MTRSEPPAEVIERLRRENDDLKEMMRGVSKQLAAASGPREPDTRGEAHPSPSLRTSSSLGGIEGGVARPMTACAPQVQDGKPQAPTPDPAVMRDYIDRMSCFYIDNPAWVALAEEARGYIGALKPWPVI